MRTHTISAKAPKNRKTECWDCGKLVTPKTAATEFCPGKPVASKKKK